MTKSKLILTDKELKEATFTELVFIKDNVEYLLVFLYGYRAGAEQRKVSSENPAYFAVVSQIDDYEQYRDRVAKAIREELNYLIME